MSPLISSRNDAMAYPCRGAHDRVFRTRSSRVPWRSSFASPVICPYLESLSKDNDAYLESLGIVSRSFRAGLSRVLEASRELGRDFALDGSANRRLVLAQELAHGGWIARCQRAKGPRQGLPDHGIAIANEHPTHRKRAIAISGAAASLNVER